MNNQQEQDEKITRMKLQTAKILWNEERRDATFLVLESIDDPRADDLRNRMGFSDIYEVGAEQHKQLFSFHQTIGLVIGSAILFFALGWFTHPQNTATAIIDDLSNTDNVVEIIHTPTTLSNEIRTQPLIQGSATADSRQSTASVFLTEQLTQEALANQVATERYANATATTIAATQAASN